MKKVRVRVRERRDSPDPKGLMPLALATEKKEKFVLRLHEH